MNTAIAEGHDLDWKLAWVLKGWSGAELLDTYELEWRAVGARRAARSADPGPEAPGAEALADDLNGRLPHAWLASADGRRRWTLDLIGPGLTLLTGPDAGAWTAAVATLATPFPLAVHALDPQAALGVGPGGALLARPDARVVARWPSAPRSLSIEDLRLCPEPSPVTGLGMTTEAPGPLSAAAAPGW